MEDNPNKNRKMLSLTWQQFHVYLFVDKKQSTTKSNMYAIRSRFNILLKRFTKVPLDRDNFNLFISELRDKNYKVNYINNFIKLAKHIDKCLGNNYIQDYTYFKKPHYIHVDYLSPEEIEKLAETIIPYSRESEQKNYRYKCLYYFLGTTGCRIREAIDLTWDNVFETYAIFRETKNGEERLVPIRKKLQLLMRELPKNNPLVFQLKDVSIINDDLKKRAKACGIQKRVYNHLFRHSFVSTMLKLKVSEKYIMKITGHKSSDAMTPYAHAMIADLEEILDMHPLNMSEQTYEEIERMYEELTEKRVNKIKFQVVIQKSIEGIHIWLKKPQISA